MPGSALIRDAFERKRKLIENRIDYQGRQLPSGEIQLIPREALKIEEVDGTLVKQKASFDSTHYLGCFHERLTSEQEAVLVRQTERRSGYCRSCDSENCPKCTRKHCSSCEKYHDHCSQCQRPGCERCLSTQHRGKRHRCRALCKDCAKPSVPSRSPTSNLPRPPETPPKHSSKASTKQKKQRNANKDTSKKRSKKSTSRSKRPGRKQSRNRTYQSYTPVVFPRENTNGDPFWGGFFLVILAGAGLILFALIISGVLR